MNKKQANIVVLGDLVGSRNIAEREKFEKILRKTIEAVVTKYKAEWIAPLAFEKGIDEVGAVIKNKTALYHIISEVNDQIAPQKIRFVAYQGNIDVGLKEGNVATM